MEADTESRTETPEAVRLSLLQAILPLVPEQGWSDLAFEAAVEASGYEFERARAACPRGPLDLAWTFHKDADERMSAAIREADFSGMKFRDRVAAAVRLRLEVVEDKKDAVRRAMSLYALPQHATEGARAVWETAGAIWTSLGDTSDDISWYTKRAMLSAVVGSAFLHWIGDSSAGHQDTRRFIDRRIADVMNIQSIRSRLESNPACAGAAEAFSRLGKAVRPPTDRRGQFPGWARKEERG